MAGASFMERQPTMSQEGTFTPVAFHQMDLAGIQDGKYHARKAGPAPQVEDHGISLLQGKNGSHKLRRIQHMPPPQVAKGPRAYQIDLFLPFFKKRPIAAQPSQCFT